MYVTDIVLTGDANLNDLGDRRDRPSRPAVPRTRPADGAPALSVGTIGQQDSKTQRRGRYVPASMAHPGKVLSAVARHAIEPYTQPDGLVIDPVCGIGTTLVEAINLGRDLGTWCAAASKRSRRTCCGVGI